MVLPSFFFPLVAGRALVWLCVMLLGVALRPPLPACRRAELLTPPAQSAR